MTMALDPANVERNIQNELRIKPFPAGVYVPGAPIVQQVIKMVARPTKKDKTRDRVDATTSKDLFVRVFEKCSRWSFSDYSQVFRENLPLKLLEPAEIVNPQLAQCAGYEELLDLLLTFPNDRRWRNPELYPLINRLHNPNFADLQNVVAALRVHVGLDEIGESARLRRFWRLRDPDLKLAEVSSSGDVRVRSGVCAIARACSSSLAIYRPLNGLFSDINRDFYHVDFEADIKICLDLTYRALGIIERYASELATGFCREISTVAFKSGPKGPSNFSMRNFYIGGVFVSVDDPLFVAENLIHEYYHQCIWPWWLVEEPPDLPRSREIKSPITGSTRIVAVMIQAALIYKSLVDFFDFVLDSQEAGFHDEHILNRAQARQDQLKSGLPELFDTLRDVLADCPHSLAVLDAIADGV